jgi:hypothetical protein
VLYLPAHSPAGRQLSEAWRLRLVPTYILFDASGGELWRGNTTPDAAAVRTLLAAP